MLNVRRNRVAYPVGIESRIIMSRCKINICFRLLKELYGELPAKVGYYLMTTGPTALKVISLDTKLTINQVCSCLYLGQL